MRRKDREVTDRAGQTEILESCAVCRLAMAAEGKPYVVPLNFGYAFCGRELVLYFHSAGVGKKIDALKSASEVCFEMDCGHGLITGETACEYGYSFASLIGNGRVEFLMDGAEKLHALQMLMLHQAGRADFRFDSAAVERITLFRVVSSDYTGKKHHSDSV